MDYGINSYPYLRQDSLYDAYLQQYANYYLANTPVQNNSYNVANLQPAQSNYPNIQTPNFKGKLTTPPDSVSFSATEKIQPEKKDGLSKNARLGLGALVIAVGVLGIWALSKGKI